MDIAQFRHALRVVDPTHLTPDDVLALIELLRGALVAPPPAVYCQP